MLNPDHVSDIIKKTLSILEVTEPAMIKLIKATFAVESYLTDLYDGHKHGFMMMDEDRIDYTTKEYIRFKANLKERIHAATGIDTSVEDFNTIVEELDHNIAFMVCICYAYYDSRSEDVRDDSLVELARFYKNHYNEQSDITIDNFGETYVEVFIN